MYTIKKVEYNPSPIVEDRVRKVAATYILSGMPIRVLAKRFNVSKSTISDDLFIRAPRILPDHIVKLIHNKAKDNIVDTQQNGFCYYEYDNIYTIEDVYDRLFD